MENDVVGEEGAKRVLPALVTPPARLRAVWLQSYFFLRLKRIYLRVEKSREQSHAHARKGAVVVGKFGG